MTQAHSLFRAPIHLGRGGAAIAQPIMDGTAAWYEAYAARTAGDGPDGRLVMLHTFAADWTSWEMHPKGEEVILCLSGEMTVIQEQADGQASEVVLGSGDYVIVPTGIWHTANVARPATAVFITPGEGTMNRPRKA
jgi:quercetin dioxygenase-like cupin family protein